MARVRVELPPWHDNRCERCAGGYGDDDHDACTGKCSREDCTEHKTCWCQCAAPLTNDERYRLRKMLRALR